ncbi:hypothetical protein WJX74_003239 [Apatococcus lobatus]|uniref:Patatin n=1 Tax=Apatococcus lobatus TaxID=904363 RepID=A0AAW1QXT2_9CHLO
MTALPLDRAAQCVHHTNSRPFLRPVVFSVSTPSSQEPKSINRSRRQSVSRQAVKEKSGELQEAASFADQPRRLPNIFRRAVQALRPESGETESDTQETNIAQLNSDTEPSSTGLWPSTLQYLLPRLPFGSSQPRPIVVPSPAASASKASPATERASDTAADSEAAKSRSAGEGFTPFEPVQGNSNNSTTASSPPNTASLPFTDPSQPERGRTSLLDSRKQSKVSLTQQESILADSSSRWLEDRDGPSEAAREQGGSNEGESGEKGEEPPKMLFFWRSKRSKQPKPEPEIRPLKASHPALQLVRERARTGSKPGKRADTFKLGLVIEGGGMRGAVSGGSLQALHDLGLRDVFDVAYGSSAGAINATYFLSGQREGVDVYSQDISNKTFCDLRRLLDRKRDIDADPVLNLNFLLDHVMEELKPLNWEAVIRSDIPLKVVASCLDTLQPVTLSDFTGKADLKRCLQCSANVPNIAGSPIQHRGMTLVDAAVFEPVPFRVAIADGCSHIVVLATRPPFRGGRLRKAVADVFTGAVKRAVLNPAYMNQAWARELEMLAEDGLTSDEMLLLGLENDSEKLPFFSGCHVYPLFPGESASYAPVCTDVPVLRAGIQEGIDCVRRVFQPYDASSPFPQYRPTKGIFPDEEAPAATPPAAPEHQMP